MLEILSSSPDAPTDAAHNDALAIRPARGRRCTVPTQLLSCVVGFLVVPSVTFAQAAFVYSEYKTPMAGTDIWIAGDICEGPNATVRLGDQQLSVFFRPLPGNLNEIPQPQATRPAVGSSAWQVELPLRLEAGAHSLQFDCPSGNSQQIVVDVQALLPLVTSAKLDDSVVARGERVQLTIRHLDQWRQLNADNGAAHFRLFLDGMEFTSVVLHPAVPDPRMDETGSFLPEPEQTDMRGDTYDATLTIDVADDDTRATWARIIRRSGFSSTVADVCVSMGVTGGRPFPSHATLRLRVLPPYWMAGIGIFGALVILVICVLAVRTPLLRDSNGKENDAPFSLARHQMAFWTVVVVGSYVYIAMVTGDISVTNETALALIGISGATGLVAGSIDQRRRSNGNHKPLIHENWFEDLLSDDNGVSIHRLQVLIWTLVLGFFYILEVYQSLAMPEFDVTQLGLLGISSGLYVGFKFPEPAP